VFISGSSGFEFGFGSEPKTQVKAMMIAAAATKTSAHKKRSNLLTPLPEEHRLNIA